MDKPFWIAAVLAALPSLAAAQLRVYPVPGFMLPQHYPRPGGADCALFPAAAPLGADVGAAPGRFTPTTEQVDSAEAALPAFRLVDSPTEPDSAAYHQPIRQQLPQYKRQYFGFYNGANQACLHVTFLLVGPGDTAWLQDRQLVYDAGPAYWTIIYNLSQRAFYQFEHGGR